jgi:hypothetical protein
MDVPSEVHRTRRFFEAHGRARRSEKLRPTMAKGTRVALLTSRIGDGGDARAASDLRWQQIALTRAMTSMISG